ncbi:DoxX family protein [Pseudoroseomonas globiformis]|uniref:DoxX family protein n=1 Tax=Teichococcus globiformis TaxID=2307229 RepID=A0ABV7G6N4_9PROT
MTNFAADRMRDEVILAARILLIVLFLVFGWSKLIGYSATVAYMAQVGAPMPSLAALVALVVEVFVALAIGLGLWVRPLALLMVLYTLGTGLIGHPFWATEGAVRYNDAVNFYKNLSIIGGFLLLYVTGAGRYALDSWMRRTGLPIAR